MSAEPGPARVFPGPPAVQAGLTDPTTTNQGGLTVPATTHPAGLTVPAPPNREGVLFMRRLARRRTALFGLVGGVLVGGAALGAPWIAAYGPTEQDITNRLKPPGSRDAAGRAHVLGTDNLGRAILAPCVYGPAPRSLWG